MFHHFHVLCSDHLFSLVSFCVCSLRPVALEDGQELCVRVGQEWRAASLEGWKLYHRVCTTSYISYISYIGGKNSYIPIYEAQKAQNLLYLALS